MINEHMTDNFIEQELNRIKFAYTPLECSIISRFLGGYDRFRAESAIKLLKHAIKYENVLIAASGLPSLYKYLLQDANTVSCLDYSPLLSMETLTIDVVYDELMPQLAQYHDTVIVPYSEYLVPLYLMPWLSGKNLVVLNMMTPNEDSIMRQNEVYNSRELLEQVAAIDNDYTSLTEYTIECDGARLFAVVKAL